MDRLAVGAATPDLLTAFNKKTNDLPDFAAKREVNLALNLRKKEKAHG